MTLKITKKIKRNLLIKYLKKKEFRTKFIMKIQFIEVNFTKLTQW